MRNDTKRRRWTSDETRIISNEVLNAKNNNNAIDLTIPKLLLPDRSFSAIRNKVKEQALRCQFFNYKTYIRNTLFSSDLKWKKSYLKFAINDKIIINTIAIVNGLITNYKCDIKSLINSLSLNLETINLILNNIDNSGMQKELKKHAL